jgi:hypothetical protein
MVFLGRAPAQELDEFQIEDSSVELNKSWGEAGANEEPAQQTETAIDLSEVKNQEEVVVSEKENETTSPATAQTGDFVEVRYPQDVFLPYKERQKDWGWIFSVGAETTNFPSLISQLDDTPFNSLFGKAIKTAAVEFGPKYNTPAGAFAILLGYGNADVTDSRIGTESKLKITRYSGVLTYYLDMLFSEPYLVPYVGGGFWQADYRETSEEDPGIGGKYSTDIGTLWRVGALLNIDWIEKDRTREARKTTGIQGTFINVYASSTLMAESNPDPNLETNMDIGAALVLEF